MLYNIVINSTRIIGCGILGGMGYFVGKDLYEIAMKKRVIMTSLNKITMLINKGFIIGIIYGAFVYSIKI